MLTSEDILE